MSDDAVSTPDQADDASGPDTSAQATRAVRKALDDAEIGPGDYEVHSRKVEDGIETTVVISGWSHHELVSLIVAALKNVEGATKTKRDGLTVTLSFS